MVSKLSDPVEAYDFISEDFPRLSEAKRAYLSSVEKLVVASIPPASVSLLDVGAGDGTRAHRIAQAASLKEVVLLEPSAGMRHHWGAGVTGWAIRAEEMSGKNGSFDVITCLWNVIGHISPASSRVAVLRECARLLAPHGRLFIDVNYRYNARQYGASRTLVRILQDLLRPNDKNADVRVRWNVKGGACYTRGHVFTNREFRGMATAAGLSIEKQVTVDYQTGQIHRSKLAGNQLYILRRQ